MGNETWSALLERIRSDAPELLEGVFGVPVDEIREVETRGGIELPRFYVDFLLASGRHEGESPFFRSNHIHDFRKLTELRDPAGPFARRYFRIAAHTGEHDMAYLETFLDLDTSDGHDCALVEFEEGGPEISPETVFPMRETLAQYLSDLIPRLIDRAQLGGRPS